MFRHMTWCPLEVIKVKVYESLKINSSSSLQEMRSAAFYFYYIEEFVIVLFVLLNNMIIYDNMINRYKQAESEKNISKYYPHFETVFDKKILGIVYFIF